jgi:hypothetical protein
LPPHQLALELIDRAEDVEDQPSGRRGRVDLLLEDHQQPAHILLALVVPLSGAGLYRSSSQAIVRGIGPGGRYVAAAG